MKEYFMIYTTEARLLRGAPNLFWPCDAESEEQAKEYFSINVPSGILVRVHTMEQEDD